LVQTSFETLFEGAFKFNGGVTSLDLTGAINTHQVVGMRGSSFVSIYPTAVVGASTIISNPEPGAVSLASIAWIGLACSTRRRTQ
jgi:hypothetical protein